MALAVQAGRFNLQRRSYSRRHGLYERQYQSTEQKNQSQVMDQYADQSKQASLNHDPEALLSVINSVLGTPNINDTNAGTWAQESLGMLNPNMDDGSLKQVPWFNNRDFPLNPTPNVNSENVNGETAWTGLPPELNVEIDNGLQPKGTHIFTLDTSMNVTDERTADNQPIVQPFYVSHPDMYDKDKVDRVIITLPGKPRDSWKYINIHYNVLMWYCNQNKVPWNQTVLASPAFLNQDDVQAGGAQSNWLAYKKSGWALGGTSHHPTMQHGVSSFRVLDLMTEHFIDMFPSLKNIVFTGHSMGAQTVIRYAVAKNKKWYDPHVSYWVGNPGSYAWVVKDRPIHDPTNLNGESCEDTINNWPYGLDGKLPAYMHDKDKNNTAGVVDRFRSRRVRLALGLLDNGAGSTQCPAQYQGYNHLERGSLFSKALIQMPDGYPQNHSLTYISGVSHQDYEMIAAEQSGDFIFADPFDGRLVSSSRPVHHRRPPHHGPRTSSKRDWDGSTYRIIAWIILAAFFVAIVAGLTCFNMLFKANANDWDRDYWEYDSKRRLL